jgi:O-antigen ligase/Tfp pilus assembly protein PilF
MYTRESLALPDWCAHAIEISWLAAAVAVPLTLNPWGCNAFELPKSLLLRALVLLMGLATLVRAIEERGGSDRTRRRRPLPPLLWPTLAFGLALALATILSVNPRASLWGSYERQQGLLTLGAYLALFLLIATNLRTRAQAERLWAALVWGSAPVVAYGLLQAATLDPLDWRTDAASPILSTVGRANFLGSYLVLVVPLTAGRALLARRHWPYLSLLAGQLACLALTQARGAWVGFGAAALTFGLAWAIATHSQRLAMAALAMAALAVGFVALLNLPGGPLVPLARLPGLDRLATLTRTDAGSTAARLTIWRATLPLIVTRPWLGYGPETMRTVFARVFPPQLVYYQGRHVVVDRAHNLWLDLGMSAGLAGVVAFGALLVGFGRLAWQGLRAASDRWERLAWAALTAAVVGHLANLQFGFDLTASATVFWLALALAAALGRSNTPPSPQQVGDSFPPPTPSPSPCKEGEEDAGKGLGSLPYILPTLAVLALMALLCLPPLLADMACWQAQQGGQLPDDRRLAAAKRAARLWTLEPEYRLGLARLYLESGDPAVAEAQLAAADRLSPDDPRVWAAWGELYARWGEVEPSRYAQAEAAYRRVLELAPDVATYHTALGLVLAQQDRLEEGLAELERAVALDATDSVAYRHLAGLYQALGREAEADWAWREAARWNDIGGENDQ